MKTRSKILPDILTKETLNRLAEFRAVAESARIVLPDDPEFLFTLKQVFAFSDFIAKTCIRNPEILHSLITSKDLDRSYTKNEYSKKLSSACSTAADEKDLTLVLRQLRVREMLRIAWRDLSSTADLSETMTDLSALADACIDHAFSFLYAKLCEKYGTPADKNGSHQDIVVIGMGKLGAGELNFSSDVDLVFAFPETGKTIGKQVSIDNEEFFSRLCRGFLTIFDITTPDEIIFRIDLRLRPYGENGPIVMSFNAMEDYYQMHGREWERYALIKARIVAGDRERSEHLLKRLRPFVFRRYFDFASFESLRDMKQKLALETDKKGIKRNIKLGPGGIREIEFFGQVFQLIRGGVEPALQEPGILRVLEILAEENHIPQAVSEEMTEAYVFLRNTEHRLQEFSDLQTHTLPSEPLEKIRLAASMGFKDWESYSKNLEAHMATVHTHFNQLLIHDDADQGKDKSKLEGVWLDLINQEQKKNTLIAAGFEQPEEIIRHLDVLRNDLKTRELSNRGRSRVDKLIPILLEKAGKIDPSDLIVKRIIDLVKAVERRTSYIALLLENPNVLTHLIRLSAASPWIISFISQHPVLLDELLDTRMLYKFPEKTELQEELRKRLQSIPSHDLEYQMEVLRVFKQVNTLRVAAADVSGAFPLMKVSDYLTDIAETIVDEALDLSWRHLVEKHGTPVCRIGSEMCDKGFAVIAYGKLGGIELGYSSDLDLVFLHAGIQGQTREGKKPIENNRFFTRLGQRVVHILTAHTSAGILYESDMRLRPSGSSGMLVSHVDGFKEYQSEKAWTWEHQALVRARAICGDGLIAGYFKKIRKEVIARPRDKAEFMKEIKKMRERMRGEHICRESGKFDLKQGKGGIVDIEFLVQFLVLLNAHKKIELVKWTDNVRLLETLDEAGIINDREAHILKAAYLAYRSTVHKLSLQEELANVPDYEFQKFREKVIRIWESYLENS